MPPQGMRLSAIPADNPQSVLQSTRIFHQIAFGLAIDYSLSGDGSLFSSQCDLRQFPTILLAS